jgi:hypothetical protein
MQMRDELGTIDEDELFASVYAGVGQPAIGEDGFILLAAIQQAPDMPWLSHLPAIQTLLEVWKHHYRGAQGQVPRLTPQEMPPGGRVDSLSLRSRSALRQKAKLRVDGIQSASV